MKKHAIIHAPWNPEAERARVRLAVDAQPHCPYTNAALQPDCTVVVYAPARTSGAADKQTMHARQWDWRTTQVLTAFGEHNLRVLDGRDLFEP